LRFDRTNFGSSTISKYPLLITLYFSIRVAFSVATTAQAYKSGSAAITIRFNKTESDLPKLELAHPDKGRPLTQAFDQSPFTMH
jgi:hypothetical protein